MLLLSAARHIQGNEPVPNNALMNGRGQGYCGGSGQPECSYARIKGVAHNCSDPLTKLRIINAGAFAVFSVSIDNHRMIVVAEDGVAVDPVEIGSFEVRLLFKRLKFEVQLSVVVDDTAQHAKSPGPARRGRPRSPSLPNSQNLNPSLPSPPEQRQSPTTHCSQRPSRDQHCQSLSCGCHIDVCVAQHLTVYLCLPCLCCRSTMDNVSNMCARQQYESLAAA